LATLTEVSADTLRYYEREHLLQRFSHAARVYDEEGTRRVQFIRHAQECGFALAEIRDLLTLRGRDSACCDDVRRVAIERKLQLESKIRSMKKRCRRRSIDSSLPAIWTAFPLTRARF